MSLKISVLKNFANFTGKRVLESFFNKVTRLRPATLIKTDFKKNVFL